MKERGVSLTTYFLECINFLNKEGLKEKWKMEENIYDSQKVHYLVVTGVIIKDGKFLITKRAPHEKAFPNKWTVPGGKLELDDYAKRPKDTSSHWYNIFENLLRREVMEEVGLTIKNIKYLTSLSYIRSDNIPTIIISLFADYDRGDIKLGSALTEYAWVSLEEAKNYDLIEGIYEELEMLDRILNGEEIREWGALNNEGIVEKVRRFVESECKKPTSKYGYDIFLCHFVRSYNYAIKLANKLSEKFEVDMEVVELAVWLHDIGSIIYGREDHHLTGMEIAEKKLRELGYDNNKIEKVKHCIFAHRGSTDISRESVEAQIIADADAMSAFDNIGGQFKATFIYDNMTQMESRKYVRRKLVNSYNKLSNEAKEIIKPKFDAAMLLLQEREDE